MFGPAGLLAPPIVLFSSLMTLPFTILILLITNRASDLNSWRTLKQAWFQHFWWWFGPGSKPMFSGSVRPLLAQASGVVLDIGPASGVWMSELGRVASTGKITKIYGVEPNKLFHNQLRHGAKKAGLDGIYEPLPVMAQDLEKMGIKKGSVDTIITVHVLCSVGGHAEEIVHTLYEYLKPGGQWLVYEHVGSEHAPVKAWQSVNDAVWPLLLDGCSITRDTGDILKRAGDWESLDIGPDQKEGYFEALPHVVGRMVKRK